MHSFLPCMFTKMHTKHTHTHAYTHTHTHTFMIVSDITEGWEQVDSPGEYLLWTLQRSSDPSPLIKYERECFTFTLCHTHTHTQCYLHTHTHTLTLLYAHTQILEIKGPSCSSAVFLQKAFLLKLSTGGAAGSRSSLCSQEQGEGEMDSTNRAARHNLKDASGLLKLSSCFNSLHFDFCQLCDITHQNEC